MADVLAGALARGMGTSHPPAATAHHASLQPPLLATANKVSLQLPLLAAAHNAVGLSALRGCGGVAVAQHAVHALRTALGLVTAGGAASGGLCSLQVGYCGTILYCTVLYMKVLHL